VDTPAQTIPSGNMQTWENRQPKGGLAKQPNYDRMVRKMRTGNIY